MSTATVEAPFQISEEQKRQYREEGYFILERVIPQEQLQALRDGSAEQIVNENQESRSE